MIITERILSKIEKLNTEYGINKSSYHCLKSRYTKRLVEQEKSLKSLVGTSEVSDKFLLQTLSLHALGIEMDYLDVMYSNHEMEERLYLYLQSKYESQEYRLHNNEQQIDTEADDKLLWSFDPLMRLIRRHNYAQYSLHDKYLITRTRYVITSKVLVYLEYLESLELSYPKTIFGSVVARYQKFHLHAQTEMQVYREQDPTLIETIDIKLLHK